MSRRGVIFLRIVQVLLAVGNLVVAAYGKKNKTQPMHNYDKLPKRAKKS